MKKIALATALFLSLQLGSAWAEGNSTNGGVRYVKAPRFARPLVEKWISEYAKTEPGVTFEFVKGSQQKDNIDLNVVFDNQENTDDKVFSHHIVFFGEFAVLPITASGSEAARVLEGKHLNSKKLKQLYFIDDDLEDEDGSKKLKQLERLVIYSGSNASSVAASFAHNFGEESSNFRGKRIAGDDLFLNTALAKDPLGISFNALPNIFDLGTRHVKEGLQIIGLDLKKDFEKAFSNSGTLDDIIAVLENGRVQEIPRAKVGLSYQDSDDAVSSFLAWILAEGTRFNHEYGLLNLDRKTAEQQKEKVNFLFTAQK